MHYFTNSECWLYSVDCRMYIVAPERREGENLKFLTLWYNKVILALTLLL